MSSEENSNGGAKRPSKRARQDRSPKSTLPISGAVSSSRASSSGAVRSSAEDSLLAQTRRHEMVRLMLQAMQDHGFSEAATALSRESGVQLQTDDATEFCRFVLDGAWEKAIEALPAVLGAHSDARVCTFLIREQQYLELLESGDVPAALACLREQLTPLRASTLADRLHALSSLVLCADGAELRARLIAQPLPRTAIRDSERPLELSASLDSEDGERLNDNDDDADVDAHEESVSRAPLDDYVVSASFAAALSSVGSSLGDGESDGTINADAASSTSTASTASGLTTAHGASTPNHDGNGWHSTDSDIDVDDELLADDGIGGAVRQRGAPYDA